MSFYTVEKIEKIEAHTLSDVKVVSMMTSTTDKLAECVRVDFKGAESESHIIESDNDEMMDESTVQLQAQPILSENKSEMIANSPQIGSEKPENASPVASLSKESVILPKEKLGEKVPKSYDELVDIYYTQLESIQDTSQESVAEMVEMAKNEFIQADDDIKYTLAYKRELIIKYYDLANQMEAMVDDTVNSVLIKFQHELETYGYTTSIVEQFRTEYEHQKDAKMKEIMETTFIKINDVN